MALQEIGFVFGADTPEDAADVAAALTYMSMSPEERRRQRELEAARIWNDLFPDMPMPEPTLALEG